LDWLWVYFGWLLPKAWQELAMMMRSKTNGSPGLGLQERVRAQIVSPLRIRFSRASTGTAAMANVSRVMSTHVKVPAASIMQGRSGKGSASTSQELYLMSIRSGKVRDHSAEDKCCNDFFVGVLMQTLTGCH
jgi:hypothetical protein